MERCIVYVGDFDLRNENVQAHLVKNNGKVLSMLGYHVEYIGVNRQESSFAMIESLPSLILKDGNQYLELPDTLNAAGLLKIFRISKIITKKLEEIKKAYNLAYVISYQSPTYAAVMKKIAMWCGKNKVRYIVNCADLPIFDAQSLIRRIVMKRNWDYLHKINQKYADGVIAASKFISDFYSKPGRVSVVVPPLFDIAEYSLEVVQNSTPTFIYAGTPFKITGHETSPAGMKDRLDKIIDIFLALSEKNIKYILNIIGISKEEYLIGVPRHTARLMNESKICFWGRKSHKETLCMISASDFSISYRDENLMTKAGFSTKIVESVSLGTPVVINDISDTFDYLDEGVSGIKLIGDMNRDIQIVKGLCELTIEERSTIKKKVINKKLFDIRQFVSCFRQFFELLG